MLIPLDRVLYPPNMPAGMDWAVIGLWVCKFRKTPQPCNPKVIVSVEGDYYRIRDGRHRVTAAMVAGRTHIDVVLETG